ncbi:uncharacterized protein LOC125238771 [Leguminivora glycinivorella]|uniref:uncharacterized protein LOC125238771 n=1 Tax=Leguminivora glycinivorella TaxID=1035111 RepID=UPI0020109AAC|nr:uncharacterized protein LOC125238771 [Leguminivora glycinivorella]
MSVLNTLSSNAVDTLDVKVELADQDWSTVPSTPAFLPRKKAKVSDFVMNVIKESDEIISKALSLAAQSKESGGTNIDDTGLEGISKASNPASSIEEKLRSQKATVVPNSVSSTKAPISKQKNSSNSTLVGSDKSRVMPNVSAKHTVLTPPQTYSIKKTPKLSDKSKKKRAKLIARGIPEKIATALCVMTLPDLLKRIPSLRADFPNTVIPEESQIMKQSGDKPNPDTPLRVGIQNSEPMSKEQMAKVHRHLILAIAEQQKDGSGPEFVEFKHMDGWILVTCADKRSQDWLVSEVKYLEPWPDANLSIMAERKLPKLDVAKVLAFIPESEATSVQEALELLRAQNKGLNTEQWTVVEEKLETGKSWTVKFNIDEESLNTLKTLECQAAIGFTKMNFKIVPLVKTEKPETNEKSSKPETNQKSSKPATNQKSAKPETNQKSSKPATNQKSAKPETNQKSSKKESISTKKPLIQEAKDKHIRRSNINSQPPVVKSSKTVIIPQTQKSTQCAEKPPSIGFIKNMVHDARLRIEEIKQKQLSDRRFRWGRWDEPPSLSERNMPQNTAQPSAAPQVFNAPATVALGRNPTGGITVIQQNFPTLPTPVTVPQTTGRNPNLVHRMEIPGFGAPNANTLGGMGTGITITVPQQNNFGGNPNMAHRMELPRFGVPNASTQGCVVAGGTPLQNSFTAGSGIGTNLSTIAAQAPGRNLTMMPPNTVIPGHGVPNAATLAGSRMGGVAPQQNVYSAPPSQMQEMDYFLGPGGGSQFVQKQMMGQNSVNYSNVPMGQNMNGVGDAAYQQNLAHAAMYPYANASYYMNCYQDPQAAKSMPNQNSNQQGPVAQLPSNSRPDRSKDSRQRTDISDEGYKSWIIEETKRFLTNDHSSMTSAMPGTPPPPRFPPTPSPPPPPIIGNYSDQDSDEDMHSRSYLTRQSPQDDYASYRRSYDSESPPRSRRESPQADSDWDMEDYESYKRSQHIREGEEDQIRRSGREFRSPDGRNSYRLRDIEGSYEISQSSGMEMSDREIVSRPDRRSPLPMRNCRPRNIEDTEINEKSWDSTGERDVDRFLRNPLQTMKEKATPPINEYRSQHVDYSETNERSLSREERDLDMSQNAYRKSEKYERNRSSFQERDDLDRALRPGKISPQPMKDYRPRNLEDSENNEKSQSNRSERDPDISSIMYGRPDRNPLQTMKEKATPPIRNYRSRNTDYSETDEKSLSEEERDMVISQMEYRKSETFERNRSSFQERDDFDRALRPGKILPQPMKDYRPQNIEDSQTNEKNSSIRIDKGLNIPLMAYGTFSRPDRTIKENATQPMVEKAPPTKDFRPWHIEGPETNEKSPIIREERVLEGSLRPDRFSQPYYVLKTTEDIKNNDRRKEGNDLDKSSRPDRRSPQPKDFRPRNIDKSKTSERSEREQTELNKTSDRKSPQSRIDNKPRNEGCQTSDRNRSSREKRDDLHRKSPPPRDRPRDSEDPRRREEKVRDRSPRPYRRSPPRIDRPGIESRRDGINDRGRPRPPLRNDFRRDVDAHSRFPDRQEGPGTRGIQRPRDRDGNMRDRRDRSPNSSRSNQRDLRRPDIRPRR